MAKTIEQLKTQSAEIKNATVVGENTATRVGTLFTDIVEHVEQYEAEQTEETKANANNIAKNAQAIADEVTRAKAAEEAIIYDVSAHNNGAVFETLQALLSSSDLDTLIPESFRHGGMTIRFIQGSEQSSDNKYVQYRLMAQNFTTDITQWQGVDDEPTAGSDNLVKSGDVHYSLLCKRFGDYKGTWFNGYITNGGVFNPVSSDTGFKTTDYIYLKNGQVIKTLVNNPDDLTDNYPTLCVYDLKKAYSSRIETGNVCNYTATDDCYVRVCGSANYMNVLLEEKTSDAVDTLYDSLIERKSEPYSNYINGVILYANNDTVSGYNGWKSTKFIYLKIGEKVIYDLGADPFDSNFQYRNITIFNNNGYFDSAPLLTSRNGEYVATSNCYVRFSIHDGGYIIAPEDKLFTPSRIDVPSITFKLPNDALESGCLRYDGTIIPETVTDKYYGWKTTPYIPLGKGGTIEIAVIDIFPSTVQYRFICVYNTDKSIKTSVANDSKGLLSYTADSDCYVRVCGALNRPYAWVTLKNTKMTFAEYTYYNSYVTKRSRWAGKKVYFFGTSITEGIQQPYTRRYVDHFTYLTGCNSVNLGKSGSPLADILSNPEERNLALVRRVETGELDSLVTNPDLIVIEEGTNDGRLGLGDPNNTNVDGSLNSTFYGAAYYVLRYFRNRFPTVPIVWMTPLHSMVRNPTTGEYENVDSGHMEYNYSFFTDGIISEHRPTHQSGVTIPTRKEIVEAIKHVCEFFAIPVIDMYSISTINPIYPANSHEFVVDGVHPSDKGSERMAQIMYPILENIIY